VAMILFMAIRGMIQSTAEAVMILCPDLAAMTLMFLDVVMVKLKYLIPMRRWTIWTPFC